MGHPGDVQRQIGTPTGENSKNVWVRGTFCLEMAVEITRIDNMTNEDQPCRMKGKVQVQVLGNYLPLETRGRRQEATKGAGEGTFRKYIQGNRILKGDDIKCC